MLRSSGYSDAVDNAVTGMSANAIISRSERTLALLGGGRFIHLSARDLSNPAKVTNFVREGLPVRSAQYARKHSGVPNHLFDKVVARTTLNSARNSKSKRLSKHLSETILRAVKIIALAEEAFGDHDRAMHWLNNANPAMGDEFPITLTDTESGAKWVELVLSRMMHGIDG